MKKNFKTIALAIATIGVLTACDSSSEESGISPDKTPVTVGNLAVGNQPTRSGVQQVTKTRAIADWTSEYEAFLPGDLLKVVGSVSGTTTYQYRADATWVAAPGEGEGFLYKENIAPTEQFTAQRGSANLMADQSSLAGYREADYIEGNLMFNGTQLVNETGTQLQHQHVDVVIHVTPTPNSINWEGVDFVAHMAAATVRIYTGDATPEEIAPYVATLTPQAATYRAVIPVEQVPASDSQIISIQIDNRTLVGKYTTTATIEAGKRLVITMDYDNKHLLTVTNITVDAWTAAPGYEAEYSPYNMIVRTADDLRAFAKLVNEDGLTKLTAIQVAPIDLSAKEWLPIGTTSFAGIYNGGGHAISGLVINTENDNQGLFGKTDNAKLIGINLKNVSVKGASNIGALVGHANGTIITNCNVEGGSITGTSNTNALVGLNEAAILTNCNEAGVIVNN
ncbi:fimbrillin family protein [Bacteroides sp. 224]|uniref:fimbrillin family protein n=1 Tax=Bacteroides sp. 224 TaxID=2302936 RepID=UPI0013D55AE3|nr:fimbrillin family protein [Bacteroides sp. 224]NDV65580.1 hypothetical protein [Bacteroides sp. 224]